MSATSSSSALQGMLYLVHTMAKLACYCLGLVIPSYETYKVATTQKKSDNPDDWMNSHKKWIAYWTFYFFYTYLVEYLLEHYIVQQLEFYYELRLVVIIILLYTNTSVKIYELAVESIFKDTEADIDAKMGVAAKSVFEYGLTYVVQAKELLNQQARRLLVQFLTKEASNNGSTTPRKKLE